MYIGRVSYILHYLFLCELLIRCCLVYREKGEGEKQSRSFDSLRFAQDDSSLRDRREFDGLEQNHNFHAHNSLIKGVDFLRKSTL